jgi:Amt family ammonium transporter
MQRPAIIPLLILLAISLWAVLSPSVPTTIVTEGINSGDTAWMLMATALVLLMTPGLAYFYGGMVSNKNVISTMLQSFVAMGVISIIWVVCGFSLAFGAVHGPVQPAGIRSIGPLDMAS